MPTKKTASTELVHPNAEGFNDKVTPKKPDDKLFFFKCKCGKTHFRHAGYMQVMVPFMRANSEKKVAMDDLRVMVCVACKKAYVWLAEQMYDVTDEIDLTAWEKTEREAQRATGPGGQC